MRSEISKPAVLRISWNKLSGEAFVDKLGRDLGGGDRVTRLFGVGVADKSHADHCCWKDRMKRPFLRMTEILRNPNPGNRGLGWTSTLVEVRALVPLYVVGCTDSGTGGNVIANTMVIRS
jgi:hypothetical protein